MNEPADHGWLKRGSTSTDEVRRSYDGWAGTYDADLVEWDYQAPVQGAALLRDAIPATGTVLDAGCGTGLVGTALRGAGFTGAIDGIDLSPASLDKARARDIYRDLHTADFRALPLAIGDGAYDALICIGVLTYVPDSEAILRDFARIVRQGGIVLVTQRDDLLRERGFEGTIRGLVDRSVYAEASVTEPKPYLPANPDFGADINVVYAMLTVARARVSHRFGRIPLCR